MSRRQKIREAVAQREPTRVEKALKKRQSQLKETRQNITAQSVEESLERTSARANITWQGVTFGVCVAVSCGLLGFNSLAQSQHDEQIDAQLVTISETQKQMEELEKDIASIPGQEARQALLAEAKAAGDEVATLQTRYLTDSGEAYPEISEKLTELFTPNSYAPDSPYYSTVQWFSPFGNAVFGDTGAGEANTDYIKGVKWTMQEPTLLDRGSVEVMWQAQDADGVLVALATGRYDTELKQFYRVTVTITEDGVAGALKTAQAPASAEPSAETEEGE